MYPRFLKYAKQFCCLLQETSGSAFAIIIFVARISSGGLVMAIQEFYPENG